MGVLGWRPAEFWAATPAEFFAACDGWRTVNDPRGTAERERRRSFQKLLDQAPATLPA